MRQITIDECNWVSGGIDNIGVSSDPSGADGTGESGQEVGSDVAAESVASFDPQMFTVLTTGAGVLIGAVGAVVVKIIKK